MSLGRSVGRSEVTTFGQPTRRRQCPIEHGGEFPSECPSGRPSLHPYVVHSIPLFPIPDPPPPGTQTPPRRLLKTPSSPQTDDNSPVFYRGGVANLGRVP